MTKKRKLLEISIIFLSAILFFGLITFIYGKANSTAIFEHCAYDTFTLQAMAWRKGEVKLDKNYPYLELAIYNEEYFSTHDKDDYMSYREFFGDVNVIIEDKEGNEYYVSFPPFPSVPMYLLTFIFGENTPSTFVCILYIVGAFVFAILLARRLGLNLVESICAGAFTTIASSGFFLATNYIAGGVWFMAQSLSLLLTLASFYFINGNRTWEHYLAFILLAFAVGCRPFQIIYFFYFAYVMHKKYDFKFFKTLKFYVAPAIIGCVYAWYNYIRFGNPLEFGHNYLPEFMRMPYGQFSFSYISENLKNILFEIPKIVDGKLEFYHWGFAFYFSNVIFDVLAIVLVVKGIIYLVSLGKVKKNNPGFKSYLSNTVTIECILMFVLLVVHFFGILMHRTLGAWQFGSRYTVDLIPGVVVLIGLVINDMKKRDNKALIVPNRIGLVVVYCLSGFILIAGSVFNVVGTYMMFP